MPLSHAGTISTEAYGDICQLGHIGRLAGQNVTPETSVVTPVVSRRKMGRLLKDLKVRRGAA